MVVIPGQVGPSLQDVPIPCFVVYLKQLVHGSEFNQSSCTGRLTGQCPTNGIYLDVYHRWPMVRNLVYRTRCLVS
jgi:hypothetical protein